MKKSDTENYVNTDQEANRHPVQWHKSKATINALVRDARLLQEDTWMREWETRNVKHEIAK